MVSVAHVVSKIISSRPFIIEGMSHGIISFGGLAAEIKPLVEKELGKKVKPYSIIMALRRQAEKLPEKSGMKPFELEAELTLKSNLCDFCVLKSHGLLGEPVKKIYKIVDFEKGDTLNFIQGFNEVSILVNEKHAEKIKEFLQAEKILNFEPGLVSIALTFNKKFYYTPGAIFSVLRHLAWENVNIFEIVSTMTELTFFIKKTDAVKAYSVLEGFLEKNKKK